METITLQAGNYEHISQSFARYLSGAIEARLYLNHQVEQVKTKASEVITNISRVMTNIEGIKQRRRSQLSSVEGGEAQYHRQNVTSVECLNEKTEEMKPLSNTANESLAEPSSRTRSTTT